MTLENYIKSSKAEIRDRAKSVGLDFFEVIFELLDADQMNAVAAYGGFPNRYPHWRFDMEYERLSKTYVYGFSKIYEMVVNNDPCYAYLMRSNSLVDQKMVMAHVFGHSDFFKNNTYFNSTNRKMMDSAGNHRTKMQRLMMRHGQDKIEDFIDQCLSLENLIHTNAPMIAPNRRATQERLAATERARPAKSAASADADEAGANESFQIAERDVLLYLLERAPLHEWQQEVLSIIREEAYYFAPQRQSKIMNEGWASFWHSKLMTGGLLHENEVIDYAERHAGTLQATGGQLNPYKLGIEMYRDIERRWNEGRFGRDYEECDNMQERELWDKNLGLGREKIFEVRRLHNDVTFLDTFLTPELCEQLQLFTYSYDAKNSQYEVRSRTFEQVKNKLLQTLTNSGNPVIEVLEGSPAGRGELYLRHVHENVDLKLDHARETLRNLHLIWKKTVHIETVVDDIPKVLSFDGNEHRERRVSV